VTSDAVFDISRYIFIRRRRMRKNIVVFINKLLWTCLWSHWALPNFSEEPRPNAGPVPTALIWILYRSQVWSAFDGDPLDQFSWTCTEVHSGGLEQPGCWLVWSWSATIASGRGSAFSPPFAWLCLWALRLFSW